MSKHLLLATGFLFVASCYLKLSEETESPSEAGASLDWWYFSRVFPDGQFYTENYQTALSQIQSETQSATDRNAAWQALGPKNVGGRTLCMAIHPNDTNQIWLGSASGGIWKTVTAGRGPEAWQRVETGFPVLGVSALAIDPGNPKVMYAGTGEVYYRANAMPNVAVRTTRGSYGIGILKTTDGGLTWSKALDWSYGDLRGVQDIKLNPLRPSTVFAATTEGLLRSYDAGATWHTIHGKAMAVDIELHPTDTNLVFVTHGSLNDEAVSGIYRSTDGGNSFAELTNGLPGVYTGKAMLGISPSKPNIIYASIGNDAKQDGLYYSSNFGTTWTKVNSTDVCQYQGWYSHDVAVHPMKPQEITWVGIDCYKSTNSGNTAPRKTFWYKWYFGQVPVGGPEGPKDYVHADVHRAYYHPKYPDKLYVVTDGGLFVSNNAGDSYEGLNGGYQTQQFYANFSNSTTDPEFSIGGLQDNGTVIYTGSPAWTRVLGGDGACTAINPLDDNIVYASSQYLNMQRSDDGGKTFINVSPPEAKSEVAAFNGAYELAPSKPNIIYAGAQSLFRSDDSGQTWNKLSFGFLAGTNVIVSLGINPANPDILFCGTTSSTLAPGTSKVIRFNAATGESTTMVGLPNRVCMDLVFHPVDTKTIYAVFSGFKLPHLWRTTDNGATWTPIDNGLPDVPTSTLVVDPVYPSHLYVGNDLGVWHSKDSGQSWSFYSEGAPTALMVMHLTIPAATRKLRVATYGLGVWQTDLAISVAAAEPEQIHSLTIYPNPVVETTNLQFELNAATEVRLQLLDASGKMVQSFPSEYLPSGTHSRKLNLTGLPAGWYVVEIMDGQKRRVKSLLKQ